MDNSLFPTLKIAWHQGIVKQTTPQDFSGLRGAPALRAIALLGSSLPAIGYLSPLKGEPKIYLFTKNYGLQSHC